MSVVNATNPWGVLGGLEAQRTDLWRLNLQNPIAYFQTQADELFASVNLAKEFLPSLDEAWFYALRATLPVQKINSRRVIQGTVPRNLPAYFEAIDTVRVDFVHTTAEAQTPLMTLLEIWRAFTRMGRVGGNDSEDTLLLPDATFKPTFKFDLGIQMINGDTTGDDLIVGYEYTLADSWPRFIQQNQIDRGSSGKVHMISAQFQAREII